MTKSCKDCLHYDICSMYYECYVKDEQLLSVEEVYNADVCSKYEDKIVHCKDCKYLIKRPGVGNFCNKYGEFMSANIDFCSKGELRDDNKTIS